MPDNPESSTSPSELLKNTIPQWTNRKKVVKWSLLTFGFIFVTISMCAAFSLIWATLHPDRHINIAAPISSIIENILWVIGIAYMAIVGSYVFGAQWDITSFRKFIGPQNLTTNNQNNQGD